MSHDHTAPVPRQFLVTVTRTSEDDGSVADLVRDITEALELFSFNAEVEPLTVELDPAFQNYQFGIAHRKIMEQIERDRNEHGR